MGCYDLLGRNISWDNLLGALGVEVFQNLSLGFDIV